MHWKCTIVVCGQPWNNILAYGGVEVWWRGDVGGEECLNKTILKNGVN